MTIQILHYEFLGPIKLSEWGPPMDKVIFVILAREKDTFNVIYVEQSEKTDKNDFFTKNEKFKCWLTHADQAHTDSNESSSILKLGRCQIPHCTCVQYLDTMEKIDEDLL